MGLQKAVLKQDIIKVFQDAKEAVDRDDAIEMISAGLSDAFDAFVKTASIYATPANVLDATMLAGGTYAVAATNNLESTIS